MKKAILLAAVSSLFHSYSTIACWSPPRPLLKEPESFIDSQFSYYSLCKYDYSFTPPGVFCKPYNNLESRFEKVIVYQFNQLKHQQTKDVSDAKARASSMEYESKNYAAYLEGAEKFNSQNYAEALEIFVKLSASSQSFKDKVIKLFKDNYSWVREASTYMVARTLLVMSQDKWDGYSDPLKLVDQQMLSKADAAFQHYLKEYSQGLYASSALNIKRKILYLAGNQKKLDEELKLMMSKILNHAPAAISVNDYTIQDVINEFKYYFKGDIDVACDHPMLITYKLLNYEIIVKLEEVENLKNREQDFALFPGLFKYLYSLGLYNAEQYARLLAISEEPLTDDLLSKSTTVLRARAFAKLNRNEEALKAFTELYKLTNEDILEGEIADLELNMGNGIGLYATSSPLKREKNLRAFALRLTNNELEKGINLKDVTGDKRQYILEELIRRYLLSRRFKELSLLLNFEVNLGKFENIKPTVLKLADHDNDPHSLVELAEFLYQNYITPQDSLIDPDPYTEGNILSDIKQSKELFEERTKNYEPPINYLRIALRAFELKGKYAESEAKALHYMVECMHGFERHQRCTWSRELHDYTEGKKAFRKLHKYFKNSPWTAKTPYYYLQ